MDKDTGGAEGEARRTTILKDYIREDWI